MDGGDGADTLLGDAGNPAHTENAAPPSLTVGDYGSHLFSSAGRAILSAVAGDNPLALVVGGTVLDTASKASEADISGALAADLPTSFGGALSSAVSSLLVGGLEDALGVEGFEARAFGLIANQLLVGPATETALAALGLIDGSGDLVANLGNAFNTANLLNAGGGFIGSQLAGLLVRPETVGGQIGGAVGFNYGYIKGQYYNSVGPKDSQRRFATMDEAVADGVLRALRHMLLEDGDPVLLQALAASGATSRTHCSQTCKWRWITAITC